MATLSLAMLQQRWRCSLQRCCCYGSPIATALLLRGIVDVAAAAMALLLCGTIVVAWPCCCATLGLKCFFFF
jgi:hypothetical protein